MWDLDTLHKLHHEVNRGGLRLVFTTLVIRRHALVSGYPGGLNVFLNRYPGAWEEWGLVAVAAMSTGEIGALLEHLADCGLERDCAVGDQFGGPMLECPDIEFYPSRPDRPLAPAWKAVLRRTA